MSDTDARLVLIGLSGVSEASIRGWAATGVMPCLAKLCVESTIAPLVSGRVTGSTVSWTSLLTGRQLPNHGVFDRDFVDVSRGEIRHAGLDQITSPELWRIVAPGGFAKHGRWDSNRSEFTAMRGKSLVRGYMPMPKGSRDSLAIALTTGSVWKRRPRHAGEAEALAARQIADIRMAASIATEADRNRDWKLLSVRLRCLAGLQRYCWTEFTPDSRNTEARPEFDTAVRAVMTALDEAIGRLSRLADKRGAAVAVVSENGFGPLRNLVNVNGILRIHGIQKPAASLVGWSRRGHRWARRAGHGVARHFSGSRGRESFEALGARNDCDWSRTLAFAPFGEDAGLVYLTPKARKHNQRSERVTLEIAEIFRLIADPSTGRTVFSDVIPVRPRWNIDPAETGWPEIIAIPADGYHPQADWRFKEKARVFRGDTAMPGGVYDSGAVLLRNFRFVPDVRPVVRVVDMAPTILDQLGIPVPESMEGTSLSRPMDKSIYQPHIRPDGSRWHGHHDSFVQTDRFPSHLSPKEGVDHP